jgi:hypothetical protein
MARKVTVFQMGTNDRVEFNTSASTWGEIKRECSAIGSMATGDLKAVVKQTKVTLDHNEAVVPDQDVTIYLVPNKNKSGNEMSEAELTALINEIAEIEATTVNQQVIDAIKADLADLAE